MKDSVIAVRLPRTMRRWLETLARRAGRSLSQQVLHERRLRLGLAQFVDALAGHPQAHPSDGFQACSKVEC